MLSVSGIYKQSKILNNTRAAIDSFDLGFSHLAERNIFKFLDQVIQKSKILGIKPSEFSTQDIDRTLKLINYT